MGWCSATIIFDEVVGALLDGKDKKEAIKALIQELEDNDWDCQSDSDYFEHPLIDEIFKELHPDWFDE